MKIFNLVLLSLILCLCSVTAAQERADTVLEDYTDSRRQIYLKRQQVIIDLSKQIEVELQALKKEMPKSEKQVDLAIRDIEKGISNLTAIRRQFSEKKQILVEACFIEIPADKHNKASARVDQNLSWENGKGVPTPSTAARVEKLKALGNAVTAPKLLVLDGGKATIETADNKTFFYLEKRAGNLYEMKKTKTNDGLVFHMRANIKSRENGDVIAIESQLKTTSVIGRTPCEEGAQTIALPVVSTRESAMNLSVTPGQWFVIPAARLDTSAKSLLACAIRATILE